MTPNPTHRKRLATAVSQATSVPYQRALDAVIQASNAGELPARLDADGMQQAIGLLTERLGGPAESFEAFLDRHTKEPTARQCERWAAARPNSPEAAPAWINAAWQHSKDGAYRKALELFQRAEGVGDARCRQLSWAGQAEQLHRLGEREEARTKFLALAEDLSGPSSDGDLLMQVCDSLTALSEPAIALEWCDRLLAGFEDPFDEEAQTIVMHRQGVREELGLEPDKLDLLVLELFEQEDDFIQTLNNLFDETDRAADLRAEPGGAFDGLVLVWAYADVPRVRDRWPHMLPAGDTPDLAAYRRSKERRARRFSDDGAHRVFIVRGELDEYLRFAAHENADPDRPETLTSYTQSLHARHPDAEMAWPPPRNGPCWCGFDAKYKRCCGNPAAS